MSDVYDESRPLSVSSKPPEESNVVSPPVWVAPPLRCLPTSLGIAFGCAIFLGVVSRIFYGQWQSMPAFLSTALLIAAAAVPLAEWDTENETAKKGTATGMLLGAVVGAVYGVLAGSFLGGLFFTACLGTGIGWTIARYGLATSKDTLVTRIAVTLVGSVAILHVFGVLKSSVTRTTATPLANAGTQPPETDVPAQAVAIEGTEGSAESTLGDTPHIDAGTSRRAYSKEEVRALCDRAESLALGVKSDSVFSVLGEPTVVRDGEWYDWLTSPDDKRYRITVGIKGDVVKSIDWSNGRLFGAEEMVDLLKKAQTLRIGQSRGNVLQEMGRPSSEKKYSTRLADQIDFVTNQVTWKEDKLSLLVWQSADVEERSVMVSLKNGSVGMVTCHQPGRGVVYTLEE